MNGLRGACCAVLVLCLAGCTSGRYYSQPDLMVPVADAGASASAAESAGLAAGSCRMPVAQALSEDSRNAVFVHPGMLWPSDSKDSGLAFAGGDWIVRQGYAARVFGVPDRDPERMTPIMAHDPGTRFIGLHYSMGGRADLVVRSVAATALAAQRSGRPLQYFPILIDPSSFDSVGDSLDMESPYLGQMFILVSKEGSAWRTNITQVSRQVLDHPKTHLLYAEDFGLNWGHFGVLEDLVAAQPTVAQRRAQDVLAVIARGVTSGADAAELDAQLDALKIDYARADDRPVLVAWLQQTRSVCNARTVAAPDAVARPMGSTRAQ